MSEVKAPYVRTLKYRIRAPASRSHFFTRQLRLGIYLAIALQMALVVGGTALYLRNAYRAILDLMDAEYDLISENLFRIHQRTLEGAVILAEAVAARIAPITERFLSPGPMQQRVFEQNVQRLEFVYAMQFVASDGTVLVDSRGQQHAGESLRGREQFERTVALNLGGMYVGAPVFMDQQAVFVVGTPVYGFGRAPFDPPVGVILNYIDLNVEYLALEGRESGRDVQAYLIDEFNRTLSYWPSPQERHGRRFVPPEDAAGAIVRSTPPTVALHVVQVSGPDFLEVLREERTAVIFFVLVAAGALVVQLLLLRMLTALSGAHDGALNAKDALLRELHHRVKNNLQVLMSLLSIEQGRSRSPVKEAAHPLERSMENMQTRMATMAEVHDAIYQSERLDTVNLHEVLNALASRVISARREQVRVHVDCKAEQAPAVSIEVAVPLGLLVNELLSNASRHAFPGNAAVSGDTGADSASKGDLRPAAETEPRIDVSLGREGVQLVIQVTDNGRGFDPEQVERGLGLVLVEELATQINAETSYERPAGGGSRWEISLPV